MKVVRVEDIEELRSALRKAGDAPITIKMTGTITFSSGERLHIPANVEL